jgi:hypothetical protein
MNLGSCFPWEDSSIKPRFHEGYGCINDEVDLSSLQCVGGAKKVNLVGRIGDRRAVISFELQTLGVSANALDPFSFIVTTLELHTCHL